MILATILIWLISALVRGVSMLVTGVGITCDSIVWTGVGIIAVLFADILAMAILSNVLAGFMIVGFWPKVLLAICFSLFELSSEE